MSRVDNLIPQAHVLTVDEQSMGGRASGRARRRNKEIRTALKWLLEQDSVTDPSITNAEGIAAAAVAAALDGKAWAVTFCTYATEGKPGVTNTTEPIPPETYDAVARFLAGDSR